jgi:hypothetical protein
MIHIAGGLVWQKARPQGGDSDADFKTAAAAKFWEKEENGVDMG